MIFTSTRRKVGITMLFAIVVALYFSVLFSIAAILEFCIFRMDDFRRTQRNDYPAICSVIDKVWSVLHLSFIFDLFLAPEFRDSAQTGKEIQSLIAKTSSMLKQNQ